ncbi:MAG: 50S ribosomal protein L17 [Oligoflexia bacterium]|nr:50S ribosomal protein L17 [Oligoflexia bacterium]
MRHNTRTQSFSRPYNQRMWLMRNLVVSLVEHERISTTLAKAKELRRWAEKAVTLGKRGTLADRRLLLARIPNVETVAKVFSELAPRFKDRNGGYTRIYKTGRRPGDNAEMALIEFLDAQIKKVSKETQDKSKKAQKKLSQSTEQKEAKAKAKEAKKAAKVEKKAAKASKATSKGESKAKKKK